MASLRSALYTGEVAHHRLRPKRHRLRYKVFYLLLDLDEIDSVTDSLRLFSRNRFNLFGFRDRDHGDGTAAPLREQIESHLRRASVEAGGPIRLLTMPRVLGYVFNPLSIYFCHRADNSLAAIFYEVSNTFGERHSYLIPLEAGSTGTIHQASRKTLYVSPFLGVDMSYSFTVAPPGEQLSVTIAGRDGKGPLLVAKLAATRQALTDAALARAFVVYPLLTLKVIVGIHWEALLLWLKGVRLERRPPAPREAVTLGHERLPSAPKSAHTSV